MALRLADALGTSAELWAGMQAQYDLSQATKKTPPSEGCVRLTLFVTVASAAFPKYKQSQR